MYCVSISLRDLSPLSIHLGGDTRGTVRFTANPITNSKPFFIIRNNDYRHSVWIVLYKRINTCFSRTITIFSAMVFYLFE